MAKIQSSTPEKIVQIKQFRGLNENLGGDTKLALGEASICQNWKVTRDGNLQRRYGHDIVGTALSAQNPVKCLWRGWVGGFEFMLAACDSHLWLIYDGTDNTFPCSQINSIDTSGTVHIFGFDGKAYIMDGYNYYCWDGMNFSVVTGYIPLVATAIGPTGTAQAAGTLLEQVNKLSNQRKVWLSPNGSGTTFQLPENKNIATGVTVKKTSDGSTISGVSCSTTGLLTFSSTPAAGTNSIEVTYSITGTYGPRNEFRKMRYSELYSGANDNRVFVYGDGSNELFYSDIDYNGVARADYFPDMNEVAVGDKNTPVTGLIRHQNRLICYKLDSTWSISSSTLSLEDGSLIPSFYVLPVNRSIGNEAPGQVQLVLNTPRTLFRNELYDWTSNQKFSGNLTNDERQARRISDRIYTSLRLFNMSQTICYDDNANQEYYIVYNGVALVHNYAIDAWYTYTNFHAASMASLNGELYFGDFNGEIHKLSATAPGDFVEYEHDAETDEDIAIYTPIEAIWESGAMDFNADYMRKYSSALWLSVKPETGSHVLVCVVTNNRSDLASKIVTFGLTGMGDMDFNSFSFANGMEPQISKLRIKAKKFVYYRLIFTGGELRTTCTILGADIRTRTTGYAK